jgi:hypothetical protein
MNMIKYATPFIHEISPINIGRTTRPAPRPTVQPAPRPTVQPKNPPTKDAQGFINAYSQSFSPVPAGIPVYGIVKG